MGSLIDISDWYYNTYYEEGRMTHRGNWQGRLSGWLQQKVISSNNIGISFQDAEDNNLFKATPIQKEEFKPSSNSVPRTSSNRPIKTVYEANIRFSLSSKWISMVNAGLFVDIKVSTLTSPLEINLFIYVH